MDVRVMISRRYCFFCCFFLYPKAPLAHEEIPCRQSAEVLRGVGADNVESEINAIALSLTEDAGAGEPNCFKRKYSCDTLRCLLAVFNQLSVSCHHVLCAMISKKPAQAPMPRCCRRCVGVTNMVFTIIAMFLLTNSEERLFY